MRLGLRLGLRRSLGLVSILDKGLGLRLALSIVPIGVLRLGLTLGVRLGLRMDLRLGL